MCARRPTKPIVESQFTQGSYSAIPSNTMQHPKPQRERALSHACGQVSARARLSLTAYESYVTVGSISCVIGIALQIKKWRRALHAYDPPDLDLADGTESQDSVSDSEVPAPLRVHSWARFLLTHR